MPQLAKFGPLAVLQMEKKWEKIVLPNYCFFFRVLVKCKQLHTESHNIIVHYYRLAGDVEISSSIATRSTQGVTAQSTPSPQHWEHFWLTQWLKPLRKKWEEKKNKKISNIKLKRH